MPQRVRACVTAAVDAYIYQSVSNGFGLFWEGKPPHYIPTMSHSGEMEEQNDETTSPRSPTRPAAEPGSETKSLEVLSCFVGCIILWFTRTHHPSYSAEASSMWNGFSSSMSNSSFPGSSCFKTFCPGLPGREFGDRFCSSSNTAQ